MESLLYSIPIVLLLFGGTDRPGAVDRVQSREFITVEVTIGKERVFLRLRVPIVSNPRERRIIDDQFAGGEWTFTGSCPKDIGCSYGIWIIADAIREDAANVQATLSFKNGQKCEVTKQFRVVRGKHFEGKMRCRATKADMRLSY